MLIHKHQKDTIQNKEHTLAAAMQLSGTCVLVGSLQEENPNSDAVFLQTDENLEPMYLNKAEARLLIAALETAIHELEED